MNANQFFLVEYDSINSIVENVVLKGLNDAQLRQAPAPGQNSLAWLLWHVARSEDFGITVLDGKQSQVLSQTDWLARLNVTRRDVGTGMTIEECTAFNAQIDLGGLQAYRAAVADRTRAVVTALQPAQLEEPVNAAHLRATFAAGIIGSERARWLEQFFADHTQAWWLGFINWHGAEHLLGEACYVRSQNGLPLGV
ncbi:MAG: DinB family protein [Caldilineaceae bacterium]